MMNFKPPKSNDKSHQTDLIGELLDNPSIFSKNLFSNTLTSTNQPKSSNQNSSENQNSSIIHQRQPRQLSPLKKSSSFKRLEDGKRDDKKISFESYTQKSNISRFNESSYNIMDIIQRKRSLREISIETDSSKPQNSKPIIAQATTLPAKQRKLESNQLRQAATKQSSTKQSNSLNLAKKNEIDCKIRQDFLNDILKWNTAWFKSSNADLTQLTLCEEKPQPLKLEYASVDEYIQFYKPLVLHEIWAQIVERVDSLKKSKPCKFKFFINSYEAEDSFLVLNCVLPVTNEDWQNNSYPNEGDLIVVEISIIKDQKESDNILTLGYISEFAVDEITDKTVLNKYIVYSSSCKKLLRYIIKLKSMNVKIDVQRNVRFSSIYYLKSKLKQCEALTNLDRSALHQGIINPRTQLVAIKINRILENDEKFNTSQLNVIHNSNELVNGLSPGILLVQGPPGTGKTHTLIGMVKKIFLCWKEKNSCPKILICAPSNGAIDEIGKRLFREKDFLKQTSVDRPLRIIRLGQEDSMNEDVKKSLFIDTLIEKNIKLFSNPKNSHNDELQEKESELNKLILKANSLERNKEFDELKHVKQQMNQLKKQINCLEKYQQNVEKKRANVNTEMLKKKYRIDLLMKADVILTTLSSCCNSSLLQVFNEKRIFNCCIIDEASQCSEPEILMPLSFNSVNKLILIGDPMQLPATTISPIATKFGFGTSLFERFYNYLQVKPLLDQHLIMLNMQYRMHSEICSFPSRLFYNNRLGTDMKADRRRFPLVPYVVFDVKDTKECKKNVKNIHNPRESDFVLKLTNRCADIIETLVNHKRFSYNGAVKIGIITPYQGQKKLIEEGLRQYDKIKIEVNTIDGFQGREMDIIIISAVRSFGDQGGKIGFLNSHQRLNVGITRAKCSLFICLNAESLQTNNLWYELIEDSKRRNFYKPCLTQIDDDSLNNVIISH